MPHRVMFVCAMNVCRSPLLAATFLEALSAENRSRWSVLSRGTHALEGAEMCLVAAAMVELVNQHTSMPVSPEALTDCDLILTATTSERGALAHAAPDLRTRTFTVREAILLGRLSAEPPWMPEPDLESDPARRYSALLNARRGLALPAPPRSRWPRRAQTEPLNIPDVHLMKHRLHAAGLKAAQRDARELAEQLAAFTAIARH